MASDNENTPINDTPPQEFTPEKTAVPPARESAADKTPDKADDAPKPHRHPRGDHRAPAAKIIRARAAKAESPKADPPAPPPPPAPAAEAPVAAPAVAANPVTPAPVVPETPAVALAVIPPSAVIEVGQSPGHHPHAQRQLHPGEQRRRKQQQQGKAGRARRSIWSSSRVQSILDLNTIAKDMGVHNAAGLRKQELIFSRSCRLRRRRAV